MNTKIMGISSELTADGFTSIINNTQLKSNSGYRIKREKSKLNMLMIGKKKNKIITYLNLFFKRVIDIIGSLVGIAILIPLTVIIYIVNLICGDKGPIFYTHTRIGKNGKSFKMLKFRTMVVNADEILEKMLQDEKIKEQYKKYCKIDNDPRVTKIGKFLRKTSLDEIPQFLNILKGDMSLVGPRPYLFREKDLMGEYYDIIIKYKPGLTGRWQISGRSNTTFNERLDYDIKYDKNFSFWSDIIILFKTVISVLKRDGAL